MSWSLLEDILHEVTLTKIISDATQASGWARLVSTFFFTLIYFICVLLINWDGKEKHQASVLLLIGQSYKGKAQTSSWLGAPKVREAEPGRAIARCSTSLLQRWSGRCRGPEEHSQGEVWRVLSSSLEMRQPGRAGKEKLLPRRGACGSSLFRQKGLWGLLKEKILSFNPHHQNCHLKINCLISKFKLLCSLETQKYFFIVSLG